MSKLQQADSARMALAVGVADPGKTGGWLQDKVNQSPGRAFALLTLLYLAVVLTLSSVKLLWLDELITLHIARLGSVGAIWDALARGADPNPPVTHVLVHFSRQLLGEHAFAYRLPDFVGYWIGMLALFIYLRRRVDATWALGGTILSMTMAAFDYSYESRSYAIFYGLAMVAFLGWVVSVDERSAGSRGLALAGMIVALAGGISTNYFAVLAFLPIAAGELTRTMVRFRERRGLGRATSGAATLVGVIDFRIWLGLLIAVLPLLAYRGMIEHSIAQFSPYAWNKVSLDQVFDSYTEMVEVVLYPILALFVFWMAVVLAAKQLAPMYKAYREDLSGRWVAVILFRRDQGSPISLHEGVGIFALMAYPIIGYVIASVRGGMLSPRFVIPVCFGFAIAGTLVARHLFAGFARAATVFVVFVLAWFIARELYVAYSYLQQKQAFYRVLDGLQNAETAVPAGAPIAIPDPLLALTFQHYAPAPLAARAVFPVDFPAIRYYRHDDSPEENLWAGRNFLYTLPIGPLATFQHGAGEFLIIASPGNWLLHDLSDHRYPFRKLPIDARAEAIGGFTPLARGKPAFYVACGDSAANCSMPSQPTTPKPFRAADNLPDAKFQPVSGSTQ
jgi:hypothetical protein